MLLDEFNQLSVSVNTVSAEDIETSLIVVIRSCGLCSLLLHSDRHKGGSGHLCP